MTAPNPSRRLLLWPRALRISQWTKNTIVFVAFVFGVGARVQEITADSLFAVIEAALLFCLASSGVYLMNDVRDAEKDRAHPIKRFRPVAAGEISTGTAVATALGLMMVSIVGSWFLSPHLSYVVTAYVLIQIFYTFGLKQVALVDVFVISGGFVLRPLAGAVVIAVPISPWLLLCTFLLALFLALCKRRHEKVVEDDSFNGSRPTLQRYDEKLLDQLIAITSAATIVCYALYTLWPDTVEKFGTHGLGFTIPFVIFGLFRYLDLVYRHEKGGRPEKILLTDVPLLIDLALYGLSVLVILFVL